MKKWILGVLIISIGFNIYFIGKNFWEGMYIPNSEDSVILSEMTQLVVQSDSYKRISENEKVYAIAAGVDRNKGGVYPFHYGVSVRTDKQTYIFSCKDKACGEMNSGETTYSRYSEEEPVLPLKQANK